MKGLVFLLVCLAVSTSLFALEVGIDTQETVVFHEKSDYAPETSVLMDTAVFVRETWYGTWHYLNLAPMIRIETDTPRLGFYELQGSFFLNPLSVSLGKYTFYFGDGISKNFFFPAIPIAEEKKATQKLWNVRTHATIHVFAVSAGYIADTESIDHYEVPQWHSIYAVVDYAKDVYTVALEGDMRVSSGALAGKTALAVKFLWGDTSLYQTVACTYAGTGSFNPENRLSALAGIATYYTLEPFAFTSTLESSYTESTLSIFFYQTVEYQDCIVSAGVSASRDLPTGTQALKPRVALSVHISSLRFDISYTLDKIISEDIFSGSILFLGVSYDFQ
jgi:hypothetical protein